MTKNYFNDLIGQDHIKGRLSFYMSGFERTNIFPNVIFIAPKGTGKTHFARHTAGVLKEIAGKSGINKRFVEINSSTVKNVKQFIEQIVFNFVQDKDVTLFFDEIHELNTKVTAALLTILNPNPRNINEFRFGDMNFTFDFRRLTVIGATTERQKLFRPLLDRLTEVQLSDYKPIEMAKIMRQNLFDGFSAKDDALLDLARYARGNARSASMLGGKEGISNYCASVGRNVFELKDVQPLVEILDLFPLGLSRMEFDILKAIGSRECSSLTMLASKSGLSKSAQQDMEMYLLKHGLIEIESAHGRKLTCAGQNFIKANSKKD